jgi:hypothetical protein
MFSILQLWHISSNRNVKPPTAPAGWYCDGPLRCFELFHRRTFCGTGAGRFEPAMLWSYSQAQCSIYKPQLLCLSVFSVVSLTRAALCCELSKHLGHVIHSRA